MDGGIDWCAFGRFDADPVLCRLLDNESAGYMATRPVAACAVDRHYLPGTNVLRTSFTTDTGAVHLTDFMAVGRFRLCLVGGAGLADTSDRGRFG
jgi:GH15 family glucan-1,4-alpha-glucosidase